MLTPFYVVDWHSSDANPDDDNDDDSTSSESSGPP